MEARGRVAGTAPARHRAKFYGLSTCIWCRKTRQLLEEMGVPFEFAYVDLLEGEDLESTLAELTSFGRGETFPTLVIDDSSCVIGFRPDEIRRALTS
jgi:glutaredoxin-like protein NrdH